jgi:hypothetical protein
MATDNNGRGGIGGTMKRSWNHGIESDSSGVSQALKQRGRAPSRAAGSHRQAPGMGSRRWMAGAHGAGARWRPGTMAGAAGGQDALRYITGEVMAGCNRVQAAGR